MSEQGPLAISPLHLSPSFAFAEARSSTVFCMNHKRSACLLVLYPWVQRLGFRCGQGARRFLNVISPGQSLDDGHGTQLLHKKMWNLGGTSMSSSQGYGKPVSSGAQQLAIRGTLYS